MVAGYVQVQCLAHEMRRIGHAGLAMPVLVIGSFAGIAVLMVLAGAEERQIARVLTACLEVGLPLGAGVVAAGAVTDPAVDLHLTFKTRFQTTILRRLSLIVGWYALAALLWAITLWSMGLWAVPRAFLLSQLMWFAPLIWFVGAGALLAVAFRSRVMSGSVLGGLWVFENVFYSLLVAQEPLRPFFLFATTYIPEADYWLTNRLALVAFGIALTLILGLIMRNSETMSNGGEA